MTAIRRETLRTNRATMAATGGGKIRSRRYHISSKPYAKSRQQQPGLISRVTDTVKSIVPSWLQRYFNSGEEGADDTEQNNQPPPLPPPPPNGGEEEGPPPVDGRDSPEPSNTHTEPSTSRASLNFQDGVLSRPPLNRSHQHHHTHAHHLHFPPLDASSPIMPSSSLFSLPSTSSAAAPPGVGPFSTGFSLVKEIKDNLSQHEDDNISTTSGFSSRASDKDVPTSKTASIPQLWSPETDRTHSGPQQHHHAAQSSLKKPSFNLSVFGTSSNASSLNSTVLNSSRLGDSPFYPGKTTYGGASASRSARQPRPSTPYQAPVRRQIKAKPAGAQPCGVTSATAKRILQSLERMSSPLADAKRIPSAASSPLSTSLDGTNLDRSHYQVKRKRLESSPLPPVQKLLIPAAASVSGNRSVSFKPSLTPGGGIALDRTPTPSLTTGGGSILMALDNRTPSLTPALDRTLRDAVRPPSRQSPVIPESDPGPSLSTTISSGPAYPMSSTPAASSAGSGGGKMKRERTSTRPSSKRPEDEEVMEVLDLPAISLPISTFSLPTFSFSTAPPPPTSSINSSSLAPSAVTRPLTPAAKEPVAEKEPPAASTPPCLPFTFASPIVMATAAASPPSFSPSAGFTFSAPVAKMDLSMSNGQLASPITTAVKSTTSNSTEEEFEGPFKPAKTLKQGSVLDLLKAPGFASPSSSPVARSSPGPDAAVDSTDSKASTTSSSAGFGDLFKAPAAGTWDCDVCLVQNKPSDNKCVACTSLRPGSSSSSSSSSKPADGKPAAPAAAAGFAGTLFAAPPAGTWDCDTCLVQNKPEAGKCVACETAKPGTGGGVKPSLTLSSSTFMSEVKTASAAPLTGFGDKFKKAEGAWQCDTCMLDNKGLDAKCVACMSPKPGASTAVAPPSSSASGGAPLLGFGDKFKKPEGCWDCDVCCVQNKAADTLCVACQSPKPGATVEPKAFGSSTFGSASGGFKFGSSSSDSTSSGFKFGAAPSDSSSSSSSAAAGGGFKFGAAFGGGGSSSSSSDTNTDSSGSSGFKFGGSGEGFKFGVTAAPNEDKSSEPAAVGSGFKFGASGGIAFGAGAPVFGLSKPEEKASSDDTPAVPAAASQEKNGDVASSTDDSYTTVSIGRSDLLTTTTTTAPLGGSTFGSLSSEKEPAAPSFTFGNPGEKKDAAPSFAFSAAGKEADATPAAPGTLGGFSFGKPDPPKEQPAPAFSFGNPADKSKDPAAPELPKPSFAFGQSATDAAAAAAAVAPKPAFSFMGPITTTTAAPAPSLFGSITTTAAAPAPSLFGSITTTAAPAPSLFGSTTTSTAAPVPSLFGSSTTTAAPMFGSTTTTTAAPTPSLFGSITTTAAPMFGSTTTTTAAPVPSLFGSITTTAAPAPSMFGSTTTTTAAPAPSMFGGTTTSGSTAPAPSFVFGQAASSSSSSSSSAGDGPPAKGFLFGGSQESQNPAAAAAAAALAAASASSSSLSSTPSQPFVFGAPVAAPSFSFGATAPSAASSSGPSPFVFSPAPSGGFGASQAPSFGSGFESQAPSPFTGGASQTPAFGAKPNATPVFGQQANSTPVFGAAANSTPGGGFAFGGASAFGASSANNSTAGVFAFGGGPAGSAAPTASPSITPQPPAPGGFSFAQPPAFNMGATKSSFTASPAGQQQTISGRKIKTAVRRRK